MKRPAAAPMKKAQAMKAMKAMKKDEGKASADPHHTPPDPHHTTHNWQECQEKYNFMGFHMIS